MIFSTIIRSVILFILLSCCLLNARLPAQTYGKIDLELARTDASIATDVAIKSNASRFGFKGKQPVEGLAVESEHHLDVIYQIEFEISPNEASTEIKTRNSFIGVSSSKYGTLLMGKHDTAVKKIQGKIDKFSDTRGDLKNVLTGDNRLANTLHWISPKWDNGLNIHFTVPTNQDADTLDFGEAASIGLLYSVNNLILGVGYDSKINNLDNLFRASLSYKIDKLQLGFIVNGHDDEIVNDDSSVTKHTASGFLISVQYDLSNTWSFLGQYSSSATDNEDSATNKPAVVIEKAQTLVGFARKLNPSMQFSVYYLDEDFAGTVATALAARLQLQF